MLGPIALSTAMHGGLLLLLVGGSLSFPVAPIPIELRTAHRAVDRTASEPRQGATAQGPPVKAPPRAANAAPAGKPKAKAAGKEGAATPPQTADLRPFAPGDAHLVVLLRCDKLRASVHREAVEQLLSALPDYATLLEGTGLSLLDDFEVLLIATANPLDVTATFLAGRFRAQRSVAAALSAVHLRAGDPRLFRFLRPGLAVLTRPLGAQQLDEAGADGGSDLESHWLAALEHFDEVAASTNGPALLVTMNDAASLLRFGAGLPTPQALGLAITAERSPAVRVKAQFATAAEAQQLVAGWPTIVGRWRADTLLIGLGAALDSLTISRHEAEVELEGRLPETATRLGLAWARALLPPRSPIDAPSPPR